MGGPRIVPEVEKLVISTWLELRRKGLEPTAKEVSEIVKKKLEEQGKNYLHAPEVRKTQEILKEARKQEESRSDERKELDKPWTIGSTVNYPISPEALPYVFRVWKLCFAASVLFSIREARWVAQLCMLFSDIIELRDIAYQYALHQQVYEISESAELIDTNDLDGRIAMDIWELATARQVQVIKSTTIPLENWILRPQSIHLEVTDGKKAMEFALRIAGLKRSLEGNLVPELSSIEEFNKLREKAPNYPTLELPNELSWVFAHWLTYLSKGPKWTELSLTEIADICTELQKWILVISPKELNDPIKLLTFLVRSGTFQDIRKADISDALMKPKYQPSELLKKVGYDI
jgi:hypothetical protein